jgi:hypothetical protein
MEAAPTESHGRPVEKYRVAADQEFFHLVVSNKTENDQRVLAIRTELIRRAGLSIWQQTTNIPKDSENWFNEWYPSASKAIKIPCFLTVMYLKSPYCMKEFGIALAKGKLLAIALEPLSDICAVDPSEFPYASNALAYLEGGGQVIFDGRDDTVAEILKFTPEVQRLPAPSTLGSPPPGKGPPRAQPTPPPETAGDDDDEREPIGALLAKEKLAQYEAFFTAQEYEFVTDLLEADDEDLQELVRDSQMKKPAAKRFLKAVAARKAAAGGSSSSGSGGSGGRSAADVKTEATVKAALDELEAQRAEMATQMEAQAREQQAQLHAQEAEIARKLKAMEEEQSKVVAARAKAEAEEQERVAATAPQPEPQAGAEQVSPFKTVLVEQGDSKGQVTWDASCMDAGGCKRRIVAIGEVLHPTASCPVQWELTLTSSKTEKPIFVVVGIIANTTPDMDWTQDDKTMYGCLSNSNNPGVMNHDGRKTSIRRLLLQAGGCAPGDAVD